MLSLCGLLRAQYQLENLGRGVVAVRTGSNVYVGWRLLGSDASAVGFNVYRSTNGGTAVKLNATPLATTTDYVDTTANLTQSNVYFVKPVLGGVEQTQSTSAALAANAASNQYLSIPLQIPAGGTMPDATTFTYSVGDCSAADLDGDGEYELIVKWDPSNAKDNSQGGYTGNVLLDAYKLNGTRLWRIDLGRNIRAGAHYTQFMVYDLDGDGKAELVCKTADGTVSGTGQVIGSATADYRNTSGYILSGPEFQTVFNGQTGAILSTANYNPARGVVADWGDAYGNRVDRFINGVAYLDGVRPSVVMGRGYYTRLVRAAWDWRGGAFTQRWVFDSNTTGNTTYAGQGNHQITIGDVDGDGKDELCNGSSAIDDNGGRLYAPGLGHGDALHMTVIDPSLSGQQVWQCHEDPGSYGAYGEELKDAKTGATLWGYTGTGGDIGRAVCGDVDPRYPGLEVWGPRGGIFTNKGVIISATPPPMNFMVWWDADLLRECLDGVTISKWDHLNSVATPLLTGAGVSSNNSTKANPCLSADLLGDWREEVVWRASDNSELRIYTTTIPATNRLYTLMHDRQYRLAVAWQNTAYNQPPHVSFHLGLGMGVPPTPKAYYLNASGGLYPAENAVLSGSGIVVTAKDAYFNGTGYVDFPSTGGTLTFNNVNGGAGGSKTIAIRFATGPAARTGQITINGVTQAITFPATTAWTNWTIQNVSATLNAGANNVIKFTSNGQDLANIDEIVVK